MNAGERINGLRDRRATLQAIIRLGRESEGGPLGAVEPAEVHASVWRAEQELEQVELEIAKVLTEEVCAGCGSSSRPVTLDPISGQSWCESCSRISFAGQAAL